jgi:uncharacterized membrane-anchored protein YjiN (DUF445 family)
MVFKRLRAQLSEWNNESTNQESVNQRTYVATKQWLYESTNLDSVQQPVSQSVNEAMNRCFSETTSQWTDDSVKQW